MIIKPRQMPIQLITLYFLYLRLPDKHPKKSDVLIKLKRLHLGYLGELEFDYHLSHFPEDRIIVLNDLRLEHQDHAFQMDTLILSHYFESIVEIKNYKGTLYFDQLLKQCTRTFNNIETAISDPISQVYRQKSLYTSVKKAQGMKTLPQIPSVVVSHSSTMIKTNPGLEKELNKIVFHASHFPKRLHDLLKLHCNRRISDKQLLDLATQLAKQHKPLIRNWLDYFKISPSELAKGVPCPKCSLFSMKWRKCSWYCSFCHTTSKNAHEQAVFDYLLLISPTITNEQCRAFLRITSRHLSKRHLKNLNLPSNGITKNYAYFLPTNWMDRYKNLKLIY